MGIVSHVETPFPGSMKALQTLLSVGLMEVNCTRPNTLSVGIFAMIQHAFTLQKISSELKPESLSAGHVGNLTHVCRSLQDEDMKFRLEREGLENR